jgi:hypothetical protein
MEVQIKCTNPSIKVAALAVAIVGENLIYRKMCHSDKKKERRWLIT